MIDRTPGREGCDVSIVIDRLPLIRCVRVMVKFIQLKEYQIVKKRNVYKSVHVLNTNKHRGFHRK